MIIVGMHTLRRLLAPYSATKVLGALSTSIRLRTPSPIYHLRFVGVPSHIDYRRKQENTARTEKTVAESYNGNDNDDEMLDDDKDHTLKTT
jgi:hypothetical protein